MNAAVKISKSGNGVYRAQIWINGVCLHGLTTCGVTREIAGRMLADSLLGLSRMAEQAAIKEDEE